MYKIGSIFDFIIKATMSNRIVSPVNSPTTTTTTVTEINIPLANFMAIIHAILILLIPITALLAPSKYAWISTIIVLSFYVNWEIDPERKCFLTRLENNFRGVKESSDTDYLYQRIGKVYFPTMDQTRFYRLVHLTYLIFAFIGLSRYVDRCINCSIKKSILKGKHN